jgi:hypothetical protein
MIKFGAMWKNVGVRVCVLKFGVTWKNLGVRVRTLNLALHSVHTHIKVCGVHTQNNRVRGVRSIGRAQRSLVGVHVM